MMENRDLPELTPETVRAVARIMVLFVLAGVLVGVAGVFATDWISTAFADEIPIDHLPGLMAIVAAVVLVPAIAAALGMYEGRRGVTKRLIGEVGIGVWIGSVLYGLIALFLLSLTLRGESAAALEYVSLAGLVSIAAVISGVAAVASRGAVERRSSESTASAESESPESTTETVATPPPVDEEEPSSIESEEPEEAVAAPPPSEDDEGASPFGADEADTPTDEEETEADEDDDPEESPFSFGN